MRVAGVSKGVSGLDELAVRSRTEIDSAELRYWMRGALGVRESGDRSDQELIEFLFLGDVIGDVCSGRSVLD